ncbi:hypothetical protein LTR91_017865 [Friedmanniomyces endolithicus]|uniref:SnoaL-like domain-containing protein n=1 Tax=Friedmanniomyces endolithicus TaxID=329885 RepID=A0AAN6F8X8_9PEZI|nr:hypothetical protein LTS00_016156 [Friedmanniomyces endolithicus]KAK0273910.1 hypothetical protein LTR35_012038 [Friedmanniomyces endolithicus]KAK0305323.1 hypothetical protein LTR01_006847 [Friedmanniomyces endolithicus]KAK0307734.1 hypothetical protein LTR82_015874 [Friedmanniomyces endolithicus]KAK0823358.1 hypothetical protein LTR73_008600 [Friedmanniomyces endolithicus]
MAPSRADIEGLCSHLATPDQSPFFNRVSLDVVWDVMGTHPAAGHFTSLESWKKGALGVINERLQQPLALKVVNVVGGGADQDWATVELEANGVCKNGMSYPQRYAWVMRFDESGTIVQVRAYLDSALVQKAVDQNP